MSYDIDTGLAFGKVPRIDPSDYDEMRKIKYPIMGIPICDKKRQMIFAPNGFVVMDEGKFASKLPLPNREEIDFLEYTSDRAVHACLWALYLADCRTVLEALLPIRVMEKVNHLFDGMLHIPETDLANIRTKLFELSNVPDNRNMPWLAYTYGRGYSNRYYLNIYDQELVPEQDETVDTTSPTGLINVPGPEMQNLPYRAEKDDRKDFSPREISILLHYYQHPGIPFPVYSTDGGSEVDSEVDQDTYHLMSHELLRYVTKPATCINDSAGIHAQLTKRGRVYVEALLAVTLPVKKTTWVIPE